MTNNLLFEDSLKADIESESVDLIITDPPFGIDYQSNQRKQKLEKIDNDANLKWLPKFMFKAKCILKPNSHIYIYCGWQTIDIFKQEFEKHFILKNILIWYKGRGAGNQGDLYGAYSNETEFILFGSKGTRDLNGKRTGNVLLYTREKILEQYHPNQKPVKLISEHILKSSNEGELIVDFFAGSNSTGKASFLLNRNYIGFENNESYFKLAQKSTNIFIQNSKTNKKIF